MTRYSNDFELARETKWNRARMRNTRTCQKTEVYTIHRHTMRILLLFCGAILPVFYEISSNRSLTDSQSDRAFENILFDSSYEQVNFVNYGIKKIQREAFER
jgi:hypothetical protein